jgi:hypothetical protein
VADFLLDSLRGGLNDIDPPNSLRKDQVTICENITFEASTLGAKRRGSVPVTMSGSEAYITTFLYRHFPTISQFATELWSIGSSGDSVVFAQWKDSSWHNATFVDQISTSIQGGAYGFQAASLAGKLFLAYPSESGSTAVDRLHVRDVGSSSIRRTGLAEPVAAPGVADSAPAGSYTVTRYFRFRYTVVSGSTVLRRSEPSAVTTFVPAGTKSGAVVTKGAAINEGETNWEVE